MQVWKHWQPNQAMKNPQKLFYKPRNICETSDMNWRNKLFLSKTRNHNIIHKEDALVMPDWLEIIVRTFTFIVILFFMTKALAKKQLSELNIFEYIFGIVIGSIVAIFSSSVNQPFYIGIISMLTLFATLLLVELISLKSKQFRDFFQGKSTIFIQDGKIMEDNLKREKFTADDLLENLRSKRSEEHTSELQSQFHLFSILFPYTTLFRSPFYIGIISMLTLFATLLLVELISLKSKQFRDFFQGKSTIFIQDGKIMEDNLKREKFTADDLLENLRSKNIFQVSDVEFAVMEPTGALNVIPKKENQP